ncbi:MAG: SprT family zinc-dependent metalloprotease [Candidatus Ozemobacteraceae bacterium]
MLPAVFQVPKCPRCRQRSFPHPPGKELVNGESVLYLGRLYKIELVKNNLDNVYFFRRFYIPTTLAKNRRDALRQWYLQRAQERIISRSGQFAKQLGVMVWGIKIVDSRCRWGYCTQKGSIAFNWRLIKAPAFVIDYVIIHQLAHLLETNHSTRFWNIVRAQTPTVQKAKMWLVQHGQTLLEEI